MNKIYSFLSVFALLFVMAGCEQDLPTYDDSQARLNFDYTQYASGRVNYSFVFNSSKQRDTVWIQLNTMGFLSDEDRPFELQQIESGDHDAVPGKHYVAFDDENVKKYMFVPAHQNYARVPIIVLRDASLDDATYTLNIAIKPSDIFQKGYFAQSSMTVNITNQLSKPTSWTGGMNHYFGQWGPVKHQFMIDVTGKKWDDAFITSVQGDFDMVNYYINKLDKALDAENQRRKAAGLPYLQEADGTLVAFGW